VRHNIRVRFDVAIIGSGPAGCAVAIHLRRAGVSAAIVTVPRSSISPEIPETLPPGVCETEIWPTGRTSLRPHHAMASAWGESRLTIRHAICNPLGHGWFVDRAVLDRELLAEATAAGATPLFFGRITSAARTQSGWSLSCSTKQPAEKDLVIDAGVVVDASGRSSAFARMIGIRRVALDRLVCLSAHAIPSDFPPGEALVESAEAGWWFSVLNPDGLVSALFFTNPALGNANGPALENALRATIHTSKRIHHLIPGRIASRAARTDWLEAVAGDGWLAAGDAAFASDPLGSQGLLRALETARKAAEMIVSSSARNTEDVRRYCELYIEYRDAFLRDRKSFYGAERRWPDAPFWRSAQGAPGEVPAGRADLSLHKETKWPK